MKMPAKNRDPRPLDERIAQMEQRLALERAQAVSRLRAYRGDVKRRLTSPTMLVLAGGIGFVASEVMAARAARRAGTVRRSHSSRIGNLFGHVLRPLLSMAQLGSLGFLVKQNKDVKDTVDTAAAAPLQPPVVH